jgi:hypothetical protein
MCCYRFAHPLERRRARGRRVGRALPGGLDQADQPGEGLVEQRHLVDLRLQAPTLHQWGHHAVVAGAAGLRWQVQCTR